MAPYNVGLSCIFVAQDIMPTYVCASYILLRETTPMILKAHFGWISRLIRRVIWQSQHVNPYQGVHSYLLKSQKTKLQEVVI